MLFATSDAMDFAPSSLNFRSVDFPISGVPPLSFRRWICGGFLNPAIFSPRHFWIQARFTSYFFTDFVHLFFINFSQFVHQLFTICSPFFHNFFTIFSPTFSPLFSPLFSPMFFTNCSALFFHHCFHRLGKFVFHSWLAID